MPIYKQTTEITNIDDLLSSVERDIEEVYFGDKNIFTVWATYDGTLPAQYSANGGYLADYRIYGSAGGVGDRTVNLVGGFTSTVYGDLTITARQDGALLLNGKNSQATTFFSTEITLSEGLYAMNNFLEIDNPGASTIRADIRVGSSTGSVIDDNKAIDNGAGVKFNVSSAEAGELFYVIRIAQNYMCDNVIIAPTLTRGITIPIAHVPYGYEMDMSVSDGTTSTTTPIYIGSSPLGEGEYVDYGEGKIYRKKQIHTDTVTIDGIVWDILGYDHDTVYKSDNTIAQHSVTIQAHDVLSDIQFDAKEALFAFDSGLSAGTYHFTVGAQPWHAGDVGKTIQFTLAQAVPAGGQLVINNAYNVTMVGATISAFVSGTATTATETVTMSEGSDGVDLGTVTNGLSQDGVINSIQRGLLGSNKWSESCIRQYLNSSASAGSVWSSQTKWDRPPSWATNTAGFLNNLSTEFIANLGTASKTTALNAVTDGGGTETTFDKVFLISRSEIYAGDEITGGEGTAYPYYSDFSDFSAPGTGADTNRIKSRNGVAKYWWLRSPLIGYASNDRLVFTTGVLYYDYSAAYSNSIAPACCIPLDDIETNDWLREKFLKSVDPPVPLPALPTVDGTTIVDYAGQSAAVPSRFYAKYRKQNF